ncbi:MAG: threonine ammonia-lyase, biosynthetic [Gammaproteobacteria bacterium]|nr:MAG: threonine ammonia-lyase, biosynthetic [Gammaproteobacteria bacterium]
MGTAADYLERILKARVYDIAVESPLEAAPRLSERLGSRVLLKREDLQPVFSFKLRGAHNRLSQMSPAARSRGVICSSAGNHAQGLALSARHYGARALVVMPATTPAIKTQAVQTLGAEVVLHGANYDEAYEHALALAAAGGLTFVHPFDDPEVIAGQGTIAMELYRQHREPIDAVFVPIGGGGLASGIALYTKALYPQVRVIGVEPEESPSMHRSLAAGAPVTLEHVGIFADGVAVRRVGDETFRICRELLDDVILVSTDEICAAIQDIFEDTRSIMEPAGALAVAGLKRHVAGSRMRDRTLVAVNSGANVNFDRLRHIAERAAVGEEREALLAVEIPEQPGSFLRFCETLGRRSVTEFNYRYGDPGRARIFVGVELRAGAAERRQIVAGLTGAGYPVIDMSDDEMAKLHVRHMVGGLAAALGNERLCRFEFPERPGALLDFLKAIGTRWNISLFHYRNHGSDYGRVLAGVQVPDAGLGEFHAHLAELGFPWWDETGNPAYRMFLSSRA